MNRPGPRSAANDRCWHTKRRLGLVICPCGIMIENIDRNEYRYSIKMLGRSRGVKFRVNVKQHLRAYQDHQVVHQRKTGGSGRLPIVISLQKELEIGVNFSNHKVDYRNYHRNPQLCTRVHTPDIIIHATTHSQPSHQPSKKLHQTPLFKPNLRSIQPQMKTNMQAPDHDLCKNKQKHIQGSRRNTT